MTENIYVIDTSSIIDLFHHHPLDIYTEFWQKLNAHFNELLLEGRLRILHYVEDEVIHNVGKANSMDDPIVLWINKNKKHILNLSEDVYLLLAVREIIEKFPKSADIDKIPPAADPYLIAYVQLQSKQKTLAPDKQKFVIVTQEKRNKGNYHFENLRERTEEIVELTKIRSICDYYGIDSMDYREMFRAEEWKF